MGIILDVSGRKYSLFCWYCVTQMSASNCGDCGNPIPLERLEAVPGTKLCVECARTGVAKVKGRIVYEQKTGGFVEVLSPESFDAANRSETNSSRRLSKGREPPPPISNEDLGQFRHTFDRQEKDGRIPSDMDCHNIVTELEPHIGSGEMDDFERMFVRSTLDLTFFSDRQKLSCRRMAKKFDLKAWKP